MSKDNTAAIEREPQDIIEDGEAPGPLMMTKVDPAAELAKFEAASQLLAKLVPATIKATKPQDWIRQGAEKVYLQATGLERIAPLWGLAFGEPKVTRENHPDGSFSYAVSGWVKSRWGMSHFEGGRSSNDPFWAKHGEVPDPMDVRKAAVTNWMVRAGSMICGLRGLTQADLEAQGIKNIASVEYGKGQKGGTSAPADLAARRTALWNDILKRTGGDAEAARQLLKEVTAYAGYKNKTTGKDVPAFAGALKTDDLSERAISIAEKKVREHATWGDNPEPGSEA